MRRNAAEPPPLEAGHRAAEMMLGEQNRLPEGRHAGETPEAAAIPAVTRKEHTGPAVPLRPWRPPAEQTGAVPAPAEEGGRKKSVLGAIRGIAANPAVQDFASQALEALRRSRGTDTAAVPALPVSTAVETVGNLELRPGDVLAASRLGGVYEHFAVYVGNGRIIHYAAESGDFKGRISIHEAGYEAFERGTQSVCAIDFPDAQGRIEGPVLRGHVPATAINEAVFFDAVRSAFYHPYSPAETVARARSRLGEEKYSLPFNNCEHFALWCKTGVHESHQVNRWLTLLGKWIASTRNDTGAAPRE